MTKKLLSVLLAVIMLMSAIPFTVNAATVASGRCGDDLTWVLDDEGTLTISGTGVMWYEGDSEPSYRAYMVEIKKLVVNEGITKIAENAFNRFGSLKTVILPSSLKTIERDAFSECGSLTEVVFSEGLEYIEDQAFAYCTKLSIISLPDSLIFIDTLSFFATAIKRLEIPENVSFINGPVAISAKFEGYTVNENNQYFSVDENGNLYNKDKTKIVHGLIDPEVKEYTIPETITTIGYAAFSYNTFIEKINIPETVKQIDESAFSCCVNLKEIKLPRSLEKMGCMPYGFCLSAAKLTLPENVEIIDCGEHWHWDDELQEEIEGNHYSTLDTFAKGLVCLKELTVYDMDMDFTDVYTGFAEAAFISEESFDVYAEYLADIYAWQFRYAFGYTDEYIEFDFNEDELIDKSREPDLIIKRYGEDWKLYKIPGFTVRCFKGSTAEAYAKQYGFNIEYLCDGHCEYTISGYPADCYTDGLTDGVICTLCDKVLVEQELIPASHKNENGDGICDECDEMLVDCSCLCHENGFMGFIWKIVKFFWQIFGMNPVCECGRAHY